MAPLLKNSKGILGMNARNLEFIRKSNKKKATKIADSKLRTKQLLKKAELPTADLLGVIKTRQELYDFDWEKLPKSFVIKPNKGLGGEGIIVIYGRKNNGMWVGPKQQEFSQDDFVRHISNILDGNFSLANTPDLAIIEDRLKSSIFFKPYSPKGVLDIRVIVYNKVPVMAMLRLPTQKSGGKANLAQGGIGVGIDVATGITTHALMKRWWWEQEIDRTPGTKLPLRGLKIPHWKDILTLAVKAAMISGLGYAGIDITLDKEKGPVILELNARPGLSIQNANLAPLKERLERVKGLKIASSAKGVKVAQELFGGEIEQEIEEISGKQVLGIIEDVKILNKDGDDIDLEAKVDTGADSTSIDLDVAQELGYGEVFEIFRDYQKTDMSKEEGDAKRDEMRKELKEKGFEGVDATAVYSGSGTSLRPVVPVEFIVGGEKIKTKATVAERKNLSYPMIVGRKDLKKFLVDPSKTIKLVQKNGNSKK